MLPVKTVVNGTVILCRTGTKKSDVTPSESTLVSILGNYSEVALPSIAGKELTPELSRLIKESTLDLLLRIPELRGMRVVSADLEIGPPMECNHPAKMHALNLGKLRSNLTQQMTLAKLGPKFRDKAAINGIKAKIEAGTQHLEHCKSCAAIVRGREFRVCFHRPALGTFVNTIVNQSLNQTPS